MKASELKTALDPHIKRASQTTVKKIINEVKKKTQMKNMTATKKDVEPKTPSGGFNDLRDIVNIKKQKAVINELDSLIDDQNVAKERKVKGEEVHVQTTPKKPSPMDVYLAQNPEKIKDMSLEDVAKLTMMTNPSGNSNGLGMMLALGGLNKEKNNGNGLSDKILGMLIDKVFNNNNNNQKAASSNDNTILKYMMEQNLKTQEMLINIMAKKNEPPVQQNNIWQKELFTLVQNQSDLKNSMLIDKLKDMEMRIQGGDSLGEMKKVIDFVKSIKGVFGGGTTTPETMTHELKVKEMDFNQAQQVKEENMRDGRMMYIGDMIKEGIGVLGKTFSEPIAEAVKDKAAQFTESIKNPKEKVRKKISPEILKQEIDLGNLDDIENELNEIDNNIQPIPRKRFRVTESGK